ncbi:MAG: hypothetical protein IJS12_04105 [Lachnospiraceae bacterium]|nr:hypothetical protein [Butyrivibrio sp.]MBQ9333498.1 hypothetical protein [Lachnospiraceae bacterium]
MKRKEIVSAIGLSISLTVTACGSTAPQQEPVEEPVAVEAEQPTEAPTEAPEPKEKKEETQEPVEDEVKEQPEEKKEALVEEASEYDIEPMDDITMWAKQDSNIRNKPYVGGSEVISSLKTGQEVIVIGKVVYNEKTWYVLKPTEDSEDKETEFVSGSLLSTNKPTSGGNTGPTKPSTGTTNPAPAPSDCAASYCESDCEGYCSADCFSDWTPSDCEASYCSGSYCAAAE